MINNDGNYDEWIIIKLNFDLYNVRFDHLFFIKPTLMNITEEC
jgi:hypothetical protein